MTKNELNMSAKTCRAKKKKRLLLAQPVINQRLLKKAASLRDGCGMPKATVKQKHAISKKHSQYLNEVKHLY